MSEQSNVPAPEPEQAAGAVPEAVADELGALAAELEQFRSAAARSWKTSLVAFVILLAVIASYLYFVVYKPLKDKLQPATIVQIAVSTVDNALSEHFGAPSLDSGQLPTWAATQLKARLPDLVSKQLEPKLAELKAELPKWREKLVQEARKNLPQHVDKAAAWIETDALPFVSDRLTEATLDRLDQLLTQAEANVEKALSEMIRLHKDSMKNLQPENLSQLTAMFEEAFEKQLSPIVDDGFKKINVAIRRVDKGMQELVKRYQAGKLSRRDKLEIRLIQLIRALFSQAEITTELGPGK